MDRGLKAARSDFRPAIRAGGRGQLGREGLADMLCRVLIAPKAAAAATRAFRLSEHERVNVNVV